MRSVLYILDQESKKPLHIQLYQQLKDEIIKNYKVGDKLPSIRRLSSLYNLSKNTVESAYSQLYAEGYIESRPRSGYYVSDFYFDLFDDKRELDEVKNSSIEYRYDFFPAQLSKDSFPLKLWKRLFTKAVDESLDFGSYHDGQGEFELREEIAKYLISSRGVKCEAKQIVICSGFSDSMGLLAKLLRDRFEFFGIENPGYHIARRVFDEYGYKIEKVGVDENGVIIDEVLKSKAKIFYITPSHQYPTGATIPISNRLKLLDYVREVDGILIEDDYDSELRYENRPIPALQGLDRSDSVVYLGTFAKSLSPSLRVSYMVLPMQILKLYRNSYDAHFPRVSITTQKTLELFMSDGHWDKHVRKIRILNKKKHDLMLKQLKLKLFDTYKILSKGGGLAILIYPNVPFDFERLKILAKESNIKLYFAKERSGGDFEAIRMGFGGFSDENIVKAIDAFSDIWHQSITD